MRRRGSCWAQSSPVWGSARRWPEPKSDASQTELPRCPQRLFHWLKPTSSKGAKFSGHTQMACKRMDLCISLALFFFFSSAWLFWICRSGRLRTAYTTKTWEWWCFFSPWDVLIHTEQFSMYLVSFRSGVTPGAGRVSVPILNVRMPRSARCSVVHHRQVVE